MAKLIDTLFSYGFHDTTLSSVKVSEHQVKLYFDKGLYSLDRKGREKELTKSIVLVIDIDDSFTASESVEIQRYCHKTFRKGMKRLFIDEIEETELMNLGVNDVYYSRFNNAILIEAGRDYYQHYITISNCSKLKFDRI